MFLAKRVADIADIDSVDRNKQTYGLSERLVSEYLASVKKFMKE